MNLGSLRKLIFARFPRHAALATALAIFFIYLRTLCPTVSSGDSGELIVMAYRLGVAHPPGYPLFVLLGKLFTYLPAGSVAWRLNLFSAVASAGAAYLLARTVQLWAGSRLAGITAAALYAFSPLVWRYSVVTEVHALNQLILALLLYLALAHYQRPRLRLALGAAFVAGLGMANHHAFVFVGLPLYFWVYLKGRGHWVNARTTAAYIAVAFLGLAPYLLLFFAADTPLAWGDTSGLSGFLNHLLRREYGTFSTTAVAPEGNYLENLGRYAYQLFPEFLFVGPLLALVGFSLSIRREGRGGPSALVLGALLAYLLIFHALARIAPVDEVYAMVLRRFWIQPNFLVALGAGLGAAEALRAARKVRFAHAAAVALLLLLAGASVSHRFRAADQSENFTYAAFGRTLLTNLPPGALLLPYGDLDIFTVGYLQECEGLRPDVTLLSQARLGADWYRRRTGRHFPRVRFPAVAVSGESTLFSFLKLNAENFPVYLASRDPTDRGDWRAAFRAWPVGFAEEVHPKAQNLELAPYLARSVAAWGDFSWMKLAARYRYDYEGYLIHRYWWSEFQRASVLLETAEALTLTGGGIPYARAAAEILGPLNTAYPGTPEITAALARAQALGRSPR